MMEHLLPRGIVVPIISENSMNNTYMQMALAKLSRKSFIIRFNIAYGITEQALEELKNKIIEYINS